MQKAAKSMKKQTDYKFAFCMTLKMQYDLSMGNYDFRIEIHSTTHWAIKH